MNYKLIYKRSYTNLVFMCILFINSINAQGVKRITTNSTDKNVIIVEAEKYNSQSQTGKRQWYLTSKTTTPKVRKDNDKPHLDGASQGKYIELLPDTDYKKSKKVQGKNYSGIPGKMAVVTYNINFSSSGKYYVWFKGYATNGQDNSVHVGVNNTWPESGKQLYMCDNSWNKWSWSSFQFKHSEDCVTRNRIYIDIEKKGINEVMFSMREDGLEFDKFLLTKNPNFKPN